MDAGCAAELGDEEGSLAALGGGGHDVRGAQEHPTVVHRHARPAIPQCRVNLIMLNYPVWDLICKSYEPFRMH